MYIIGEDRKQVVAVGRDRVVVITPHVVVVVSQVRILVAAS